ncbi:Efflux pump membrane transporter BepE [uncultured Defluviicoccus sp.]|uniref:Efflux pump membrane transporter BepE n=1 Tax=metagenome TaxID=256318 RepID=A0A380T7C5_9ZZZZ|nr:Efflux pump membrane transporter BepE [uncultured Defluviicoccus sp.]
MRFSRFFIDRPIFAGVIAVFITLLGLFALPLLPLSQYPEIAPPSIVVAAPYPGASAETLAETVAAPIEQEINGVEHMLYITSSSSNGLAQVTVTFKPGTDLDAAQVLVQNRVALAEPRLPAEVRQIGVTVNKQATGFLMLVALTSDDPKVDTDFIGNFGNSTLKDRLLRIEGVGGIQVFGGGLYSMRVWIDPGKAAARNLTANEIVAALQAQNIQAAGGALGQPPFGTGVANELPVQVEGRLKDPDQFGDVVIKRDPDGSVIHLRDVARIELGSQDYSIRGYFGGQRGIGLAIIQAPNSNALSASKAVLETVKAAEKDMPAGIKWSVPYNPTEYVAASVDAVQHTLVEAILLVVLVVVIFLQTWRAAVIPILAIPVALVGTFAVQLALGFSINSLSLFALVLAVGIVVDDAIVVVENVERNIRAGLSPREAAIKTMGEVSGALVAIGLVLLAVFVPTAFVPGIPGQFFRQFAVTISAAAVISLLMSLTVSPALAAILLKPHAGEHGPRRGWLAPLQIAGDKFNQGFEWLSARYGKVTARLVRTSAIVIVIYAALLGVTGWRLTATPTGFIPDQDQGFLIGVIQLPPGASLERTDAVVQRAAKQLTQTEGVELVAAFAGMDGASFTNASNAGVVFVKLKPWEERGDRLNAQAMAGQIMGALGQIEEANIFVLSPPPVQGMGNGGGFKMMVQDKSGAGYRALEQAANSILGPANTPGAPTMATFSGFNTGSPRVSVKVDRDKALLMGVQPADVYAAMSAYLGSAYVNDFNMLGRTFRVTAQAEPTSRETPADIANLKVRSVTGEMVPIGSVATLEDDTGPVRVVRYNLFPAAEVQGQAAPGVSSGAALAAMETYAQALPQGFGYEWTEIALQEKSTGDAGSVVFLMAVVLVFLVLAAQYEAFTLPLAVILIVPMCILAAILGVNFRGMDNNILTQVGLVVLVALAAKNAILIVEFARHAEENEGLNRFEAAVAAARTRLRPILMTSFAFIFGVIPLMIATGPGAEMRQALGTAVFFGMLGVTIFGLIFTPVFYVISRWISARLPGRNRKPAEAPEITSELTDAASRTP